MKDEERPRGSTVSEGASRRSFLTGVSRVAMAGGLVGGYGAFAAIAGRFLYPARTEERLWQFVAEVDGIAVGGSIRYSGPSGETINIARRGRAGGSDDFIALSSTCPHLGCQVRWEGQNNRFFCPCHNGVFDPSGKAIGGPPGEAGQWLPRYELRVDRGRLLIAVPPPRFADADRRPGVVEDEGSIAGSGHDPCLAGRDGASRKRDPAT